MKSILFISPGLSVKGGISSVINGYLCSNLRNKYNIYLVASHIDGNKLKKMIIAFLGLFKTLFYLTSKSPDIVHIHTGNIISFKRKYYYLKIVNYFRCKIILQNHGGALFEQYKLTSNKWRHRIRSTFENVDKIISLSENEKNCILKIIPIANVEVLANSVVIPEIKKKAKSDFIKITFLGHIKKEKGIFDLLIIVKRLITNNFRVKLTIGGFGETELLKLKINNLSISSNVEFLGWITSVQRNKILEESDIFVLASYTEAMPMSILEAMAYSLPVVSTFVGGIPELVIHGESGFLIRPGDLDSLYNYLVLLIKNEKLRDSFGKNGRNIIKKRHNIEIVIKKLETIYDCLCKNRSFKI